MNNTQVIIAGLVSCLTISCSNQISDPILATAIQPSTGQTQGGSDLPSARQYEEAPSIKDLQRMVCVSGSSASNLLTFTVESGQSANPSNTLLMDPEHPDYPLIDVSGVQFLERLKPDQEVIHLALTAKTLATTEPNRAQTLPTYELFWVELNRKMRSASLRRMAEMSPMNNRLVSAYKRIGISKPSRHSIQTWGSWAALSGHGPNSKLLEWNVYGAEPVNTPLPISAEFLAHPVPTDRGALFDGFDSNSGLLQKWFLRRNSSEFVQIPLASAEDAPFGGAALAQDLWFWFETTQTKSRLALAFWSPEQTEPFARIQLPFEGTVLTRTIVWRRIDDTLEIFYTSEDDGHLTFRVVSVPVLIAAPNAKIEPSEIVKVTIEKKSVGMENLQLTQVAAEIHPSPSFRQAVLVNLSSEPLGRVTTIDFTTGSISVKTKIACSEFATDVAGGQ